MVDARGPHESLGGNAGGWSLPLLGVSLFAVVGGGLFGLDIGIIGSALDMHDFKERFESNVWQFGLISSGKSLFRL